MKQKKLLLTILVLSIAIQLFGDNLVTKKGYDVSTQQLKNTELSLQFKLHNYNIVNVVKSGVTYSEISFEGNVKTDRKGWAELPYLSASIQLPANKNVSIEITDSQFEEIDLQFGLLPSRGTIYRNQDPSTIPYETNSASLVDAWYPVDMINASKPYILRDVRGENIYVYPFLYNAYQKKLRVYKSITIKVVENNLQPTNPLVNSSKIAKEMESTYESLFVNYSKYQSKWTNEIAQFGEILVIYTSRDATVIQPWITWKKEMGYRVTELQVATNTNVKTTIQTAYTANKSILYVLLVGDWADIKSDLGSSGDAPTDPMLGCVAGADDYADIIIGRFSASTTAQVTTQGDKALNYERNPEIGGTWYSKALGIASAEGDGTGDDGEIDYVHINNIHNNRLLPFTYTTINQAYDYPSTATASQVSGFINGGISVINYCGHGGHDQWVTSTFSTTNAGNLTNGTKLPFVISVACVVGEFHTSTDCLAEALMRKSGGGAVVTWMSTIDQPWQPPMRGQDYANDILVQGHTYTSGGTSTTYGKTTFGSIAFNAALLMIAESAASGDWDTYKTWTIFGDPTIQVRTEAPKAIAISNQTVTPGVYVTQITVGGNPFPNALVSLYKAGDPQPYSGLTDASGNVTINHNLAGTVKLTVTGFNLATYSADHVVSNASQPTAQFIADQTIITAGQYVHFTDQSINYPTSRTWTFAGGTPATSTLTNPVVQYVTPGTYTVTLYVENGAGNDTEIKTDYIIVDPISAAPVVDFVANQTNITVGQSVNFTDLSTNLPTSWNWTFNGATPATASSTVQNPNSVTYNTVGTYAVTLVATNSIGSGNSTKTAYITVSVPDPCTAGSTNTYEYISKVQVGSINNTSQASNYTNYTNLSTNMYIGLSYPITVTTGSGYASDKVLIWIDWNMNGDFTNAGEAVFVSAASAGPTFTTNIIPPVGAVGGMVRMRIRLHDSSDNPNATPCGTSKWGEVEDYSINVINCDAPVISLTPTNILCYGCCNGAINTSVTGGTAPYSYNWSNGVNIANPSSLCAGNYCVTVTDNIGCPTISCVTITQPAQLVVTINKTNETSSGACNGQAIANVTGGVPPYYYQWSNNVVNASSISDLCAGEYCVTITDYNATINTACVTITFTSGVDNIDANQFNIYPNPTNGQVNIVTDNTVQQIQVVDVLGKLVSSINKISPTVSINLNRYGKGIYFIKVRTINSIYQTKVIVE